MDLLEKVKQQLAKQKAEKKAEKSVKILKIVSEEKSKKPKKTKKEIKIKTDHFRTGISLITGASGRDQPTVLKQKLLEFLESHEIVKKSNGKWYWIKKEVNK